MAIVLDGTTGITSPAIDAAIDGADITSGNIPAARITSALNASGSAPIYACRAWVNFNGTGTVAIRASGNVSSITDNGTGDYTVNFTTAMQDANYSVAASAVAVGNGTTVSPTVVELRSDGTRLAGSVQLWVKYGAAVSDASTVSVAVFR
jgi:hypothetical protein